MMTPSAPALAEVANPNRPVTARRVAFLIQEGHDPVLIAALAKIAAAPRHIPMNTDKE